MICNIANDLSAHCVSPWFLLHNIIHHNTVIQSLSQTIFLKDQHNTYAEDMKYYSHTSNIFTLEKTISAHKTHKLVSK
jgi:hypothetical protein